jgi:nucleotide-binding universal stress UspA family protein
VVGVDDSAMSETALAKALHLASSLDASVDVVHVTYVPATVLAAMSGVPMATEEFTDAQRKAVWARFDEAMRNSPVPVRPVDLEGYPADALVEHASGTGADLLVVGLVVGVRWPLCSWGARATES